MKTIWGILSVLFIWALVLPFAGFAAFLLYISNKGFFVPLVIAAYISFGAILVMARFDLFNYKKHFWIGAAALIAVSLLFTIPAVYDKTRPVITDGQVDLTAYQPFEKRTKAVALDGPATLHLEDNLPIIDGATALYPIYAAFAQAVYPEKEYQPYDSEVMSNRTEAAYTNLINGKVDIIFVLGPSTTQLNQAESAGKELKLTPIGKEAFVFFVNSKNPVKSLTENEIKGIYSGKITNWKDVGGKDNEIRAFQRPENSGSQTALRKFMGLTPIMKPPTEDVMSLMGTVIGEVSDYKNHKNAIGYTFRYYSTQMVKNNRIRLLSVNGVEPNTDTIRSGEYPITNEFYAVTAGSDNPHVEAFIEWVLSDEGQEIIEKTGYVPVGK
ncbi:PstS family phosphate ABC transporter substrate-binding protein [Sporosarcina luteola]|uniref:PstS family phosphate ABC transporter substrate-binding protein n=1 Tax=Sporosarcina luteola TaxID=582850 RepID=UPI00203BFBC9|nr:substrate-binding domain-containing protein [Sporosarcina luteola]MCM3710409.1 substrate-binding domain-containing protein [Sporosarcina luteola]